MSRFAPAKDPANIEPYFFILCDLTGTNVSGDKGELQGATISAITSVTADAGLTVDSSNKNAVTIDGVSYGASTVVTVWLSGGTVDTDYVLTCKVTTSDSRTLEYSMTIPVRNL
jgi:hypothetical protein